jgi:hypothetical protein
MKNTSNTPQEWQKNPEEITTSRVQYWANGIMITAQLSNKEAKEMVGNGMAFVICSQAIGNLKNGKYNS